MGHIKWKALPVSRMLDQVEEQLKLAEPYLKKAQELAKESLSEQSFPQYMEWDIKGVHSEIDYAMHRCSGAISRCRVDLPADALAREKAQEEKGQQTIALEV